MSKAGDHGPHEHQQFDYTKTRRYAGLDLVTKVVQAIAVVALGVAGLWFQISSEAEKRTASSREASQRQYLPELRSLTAVDLALLQTSSEFSWPSYTDDEFEKEARLGATLTYLGASLYFPDGEPRATIIPAADITSKTVTPRLITATIRNSTLLLADFMRLAPLFHHWQRENSRAVAMIRGGLLEIVDSSTQAVLETAVIDPRVAVLWKQWLPPSGVGVGALSTDLDLTVYADDLDAQILDVCDHIVKTNRELATDYIAIRNDVLRSRTNLLSP
jgi:hypothetical protein